MRRNVADALIITLMTRALDPIASERVAGELRSMSERVRDDETRAYLRGIARSMDAEVPAAVVSARHSRAW